MSMGAATELDPRLLDPREIYDFILRRWKLIATTAAISCGAFIAISHVVTPSYVATAEILFTDPIDYITTAEASNSELSDGSRYIESHIAVLRSTSILQKVAASQGLAANPELAPAAVEWLRNAVDVTRVGLSNVVELSVTSDDPHRSMSLTNAIAEVYLKDRMESRYERVGEASTWLKERAEALRAELSRSEEAVEAFRMAHNLVATKEGSLTQQQLSEMNIALINARAELAAKRSKYKQAVKLLRSGGDVQTIPDVLQSDVVSALRTQRAVITRRRADLLSKYGERHPDVLTADAERRDIEAQIEAEIKRLIGNLSNEVETAEAREAALGRALASVSKQSEIESHIGVQLRDLERIAAANKQLYETFLSRAKLSEERGTLLNSGVRVITHATLPLSPSFPNRPLFGAVGLMFGICLGAAAAFLHELFTPGFLAKREVEDTLAVPVLASIPRLSGRPRTAKAGAQPVADLVHRPFSRFGEEVRRLRMLMSTDQNATPGTILVTSALLGEGKSTLALSLAHSAAADGKRVLLVDADLRRSAATAFFGLSDQVGLVDLLTLPIEPDSAIHLDARSGIYVLPAGAATINPPALLASSRMRSVIEEIKGRYDTLIIDAPPVGPVTDPVVLAKHADKVVFVVKWRATSREAVVDGLRQLGDRSRIAGIALTMVDEPKLPKYGRYASIESNVSDDYYFN